eukprot:TRINITY_DN39223_c0_g1_i1.p1 TRINITY_DN39223_c0_g1~~TRINITY_DN39223_c0_g1_i1.p1  ORF type:complete len:1005 (-),score=73.26 TRINITY_DN39223_c0_g1_i1:133-3147(-)
MNTPLQDGSNIAAINWADIVRRITSKCNGCEASSSSLAVEVAAAEAQTPRRIVCITTRSLSESLTHLNRECVDIFDVLADLRVFEDSESKAPASEGVAAEDKLCQWLNEADVSHLAHVIDSYSMHDFLLSDRIAQSIALRRSDHPFATVESLSGILHEFEDQNINLPLEPLVKLALRVAVNEEVHQLERFLVDIFDRLKFGGRCLLITYHTWELNTVRRFVHNHEEPHEHTAKASSRDRLVELYPLLSSKVQYSVRRISPLCKMSSEDMPSKTARFGMLHVLEKLPRDSEIHQAVTNESTRLAHRFSKPSSPTFGPSLELSDEHARNADESISCEMLQLREKILQRKELLQSQGLTSKQQKMDPSIELWNARMREIHRKDSSLQERAQARCSDRQHVPVQLDDTIKHLMAMGPDGLYVDCTFGRGGHTKHILSRLSSSGLVRAFDIDPTAVQVGKRLEVQDSRFKIIHQPFGRLSESIHEPIAGVLLDLGVSSPQLDDPSRGFSLKNKKDGPLDLRMNQNVGVPAWQWLQTVCANELAWVIESCGYGLDPLVIERVADAILQQQQAHGPFKYTSQLCTFLNDLEIGFAKEHPGLSLVSIVFLAIRIFLNQEMEQLTKVLEAAFDRLAIGGRCVIISFNRWESVVIRRFVRNNQLPGSGLWDDLPPSRLQELYPLTRTSKGYNVQRVLRPLKASSDELNRNVRSRSSTLHVLEKALDMTKVQSCSAVEAQLSGPGFRIHHLPRGFKNVGPGEVYVRLGSSEDGACHELSAPQVKTGDVINLQETGLASAAELNEVLYAFRRGRGGFRRFGDRCILDFKILGLHRFHLAEPFAVMNPLLAAMTQIADASLQAGETLAILQVLVNYYRDGTKAVLPHRHRCRHICCSLGATRDVEVDGQNISTTHGDCLILSGENHSVPPTAKAEPRVSICLFFCSAAEYADGNVGVPAKEGSMWFVHPQDALCQRAREKIDLFILPRVTLASISPWLHPLRRGPRWSARSCSRPTL